MLKRKVSRTVRSEQRKLSEVISNFTNYLAFKLYKKAEDGWTGWDDETLLHLLQKQLIDHVYRGISSDNMLDVAAHAMFIWEIQRKKEVRRNENQRPSDVGSSS